MKKRDPFFNSSMLDMVYGYIFFSLFLFYLISWLLDCYRVFHYNMGHLFWRSRAQKTEWRSDIQNRKRWERRISEWLLHKQHQQCSSSSSGRAAAALVLSKHDVFYLPSITRSCGMISEERKWERERVRKAAAAAACDEAQSVLLLLLIVFVSFFSSCLVLLT